MFKFVKLDKILIATGNKGKLLEFQKYFDDYDVECVSLEGKNVEEPEENGGSFEENAFIKAQYYCNATNLPTLADDSGLCIDQLDGMPGIYSARWAGKNKDFGQAIKKVELELNARKVSLENLTGYFYCALVLLIPGEEPIYFKGKILGKIVIPPRGDAGFGYDPIFIPDGDNRSFGEMNFKEKQIYAHRKKALIELQEYLKLLRI